LKKFSFAPILAAAVISVIAIAPASAQSQTKPAKKAPTKAAEKSPAKAVEPEHIEVQHILIGFKGSLPGKDITRSKEEAKKLAYEILEKARAGEDFGGLVKKHTNDSFPGIYGMANIGVTPAQGEYPRGRMVGAFGDTGFPLDVGGIGIADFDPKKSPYGWHIVKRTK
jgi:hypothetical protein